MFQTARIAATTFLLGGALSYAYMGYGSYVDQKQFNRQKAELLDSIQNLHFTYGKVLSEQNKLAMEILRERKKTTCD